MENLLHKRWSDIPYAWSHGARDGYLGTGMMYYALVYANMLERALVLGTGGCFVPMVVRQAQLDSGMKPNVTIVDNLSGVGDEPRFASMTYDMLRFDSSYAWDIRTTEEFAMANEGRTFDFIHVDANHDFEYVLSDLIRYWDMLRPGGYMTVHDSDPSKGLTGPALAINAFTFDHPHAQINVWTPDSNGTTVMKKPES